jgi:hypothetical protein
VTLGSLFCTCVLVDTSEKPARVGFYWLFSRDITQPTDTYLWSRWKQENVVHTSMSWPREFLMLTVLSSLLTFLTSLITFVSPLLTFLSSPPTFQYAGNLPGVWNPPPVEGATPCNLPQSAANLPHFATNLSVRW